MIDFKKYENKQKIILFTILSFFFIFLYSFDFKALEPNQVELDFTNVNNPWKLTSKFNFTLPVETVGKKFHINVNSSADELIVWIYDNDAYLEGEYLKSISQSYYLMVYHYNSSTQSFEYHHDWTYYNTSEIIMPSIIYSNYIIKKISVFPDLTSSYGKISKCFNNHPEYISNLEYFYKVLNKNKYKFVSTITSNCTVYTNLSQDKKDFYMNYNSNLDMRFSSDTTILNTGQSAIGYSDVYSLNDLNKTFVDGYINAINSNFSSLYFRNLLPGDFWDANISNIVVLYTNFNDNKLNLVGLDTPKIKVGDKEYNHIPSYFENINTGTVDDFIDLPAMNLPFIEFGDLNINNETQDINTSNNIISNFMKSIFDKFPIYNQIVEIRNSFNYLGVSNCILTLDGKTYWACNPFSSLNIELFGKEIKGEYFDLSLFLKHRDNIHFYIRLGLYSFTLFKCIKILQGYFRN